MQTKQSDVLVDWIKDQLKQLEPGARFPTDKDLSRLFKVSISTIKRAVKQFSNSGHLTRIPGKGTFVTTREEQPKPLPTPPQASFQIIANSIYQSICNGDLKYGEALPPVKYMSYQFKVTGKTVSAAYGELCRRGLVSKVGKTFWVGRLSDLMYRKEKREIFLFNYKSYDYTNLFQQNVLAPAYQQMEKELLAHGFLLHYENSDNLKTLLADWAKTKKIPAGILLCNINENRFDQMSTHLKKFQEKLTDRSPTILGDCSSGLFKRRMAQTQIMHRGYILTSAARALAGYFLQNKYRSVVFFIDETSNTWMVGGLYRALFRIIREVWTMDSTLQVNVILKPRKRNSAYQEKLRRDIIPGYIKSIMEHEKNRVQVPYYRFARDFILVTRFSQCFHQFKNAPLWVFTNPQDAAQAISWAQTNRLKIPQDLSLMVLENDPRYFHLGITSCEPDWEGIGYLMAHALIRDFPVERTTKGFIRTRATVIEKLTTRQ